MPYALRDKLSQSPIKKGIEITQEQYEKAVSGRRLGILWAEKDGKFQLFKSHERIIYSLSDGSPRVVSILDDIPKGFSENKIVLPSHLREQINAERDKIISTPYPFKGTEFDTDSQSMANMAEQILELLLNPSATVTWIDALGEPVSFTGEEFKELVLGIGERKKLAYLNAAQQKKEIKEP